MSISVHVAHGIDPSLAVDATASVVGAEFDSVAGVAGDDYWGAEAGAIGILNVDVRRGLSGVDQISETVAVDVTHPTPQTSHLHRGHRNACRNGSQPKNPAQARV